MCFNLMSFINFFTSPEAKVTTLDSDLRDHSKRGDFLGEIVSSFLFRDWLKNSYET